MLSSRNISRNILISSKSKNCMMQKKGINFWTLCMCVCVCGCVTNITQYFTKLKNPTTHTNTLHKQWSAESKPNSTKILSITQTLVLLYLILYSPYCPIASSMISVTDHFHTPTQEKQSHLLVW